MSIHKDFIYTFIALILASPLINCTPRSIHLALSAASSSHGSNRPSFWIPVTTRATINNRRYGIRAYQFRLRLAAIFNAKTKTKQIASKHRHNWCAILTHWTNIQACMRMRACLLTTASESDAVGVEPGKACLQLLRTQQLHPSVVRATSNHVWLDLVGISYMWVHRFLESGWQGNTDTVLSLVCLYSF